MDCVPGKGQISIPVTSTTQTITLSLTASNTGSGVDSVALGGDWQVRAGDFNSTSGHGQLVTDPGHRQRLGACAAAGRERHVAGNLRPTFPVSTLYQAYLRIKY